MRFLDVVAEFGLVVDDIEDASLNWIMINPGSQGVGIGSAMMKHVLSLGSASQSSLIKIAASHRSAPFFAKFGAVVNLRTEDGWGPGMDCVDMELRL